MLLVVVRKPECIGYSEDSLLTVLSSCGCNELTKCSGSAVSVCLCFEKGNRKKKVTEMKMRADWISWTFCHRAGWCRCTGRVFCTIEFTCSCVLVPPAPPPPPPSHFYVCMSWLFAWCLKLMYSYKRTRVQMHCMFCFVRGELEGICRR